MGTLGKAGVAALIAFAAALGLLAAPAVAASPADWMYEPTTFTEIRLEIPEPGYKKLEEEPKGAYQPATFSIAETNGVPGSAAPFSAPIEIGVKLKGSLGSLRSINEKAAFKLKFDTFVPGQTYLGLQKMTLNNMVQDPSMVHEVLAYRAFDEMGSFAPGTGFTYLWVNGRSYGLHLNLETPDKIALEKRFGPFQNPPQHLYEGEYGADVSTATNPQTGHPRWEDLQVDEGKSGTKTDLTTLLAAVEGTTGSFSDRVAPYADLTEMTREWMTEKYIGHWDGYSGYAPGHYLPNNYYLYSDASGKFQVFPWGTDQTWDEHASFTTPGGALFVECLADSACTTLYREAGERALTTLTVPKYETLARCTASDLQPWRELEATASEPAKLPPYDLQETAEWQTRSREFISERPADLASYLSVAAPPQGAEEPACPPLRPIGGFPPPPTPPASGPSSSGDSGTPGTSPAAPTPVPVVKLGRRTTSAGAVTVRLYASGPGTVGLLGSYGIGAGRRATACRGSGTVAAAGKLAVRCKLTPGFRNRLAGRAIPVRVAATLSTAGGTTTSSLKLRLPRR